MPKNTDASGSALAPEMGRTSGWWFVSMLLHALAILALLLFTPLRTILLKPGETAKFETTANAARIEEVVRDIRDRQAEEISFQVEELLDIHEQLAELRDQKMEDFDQFARDQSQDAPAKVLEAQQKALDAQQAAIEAIEQAAEAQQEAREAQDTAAERQEADKHPEAAKAMSEAEARQKAAQAAHTRAREAQREADEAQEAADRMLSLLGPAADEVRRTHAEAMRKQVQAAEAEVAAQGAEDSARQQQHRAARRQQGVPEKAEDVEKKRPEAEKARAEAKQAEKRQAESKKKVDAAAEALKQAQNAEKRLAREARKAKDDAKDKARKEHDDAKKEAGRKKEAFEAARRAHKPVEDAAKKADNLAKRAERELESARKNFEKAKTAAQREQAKADEAEAKEATPATDKALEAQKAALAAQAKARQAVEKAAEELAKAAEKPRDFDKAADAPRPSLVDRNVAELYDAAVDTERKNTQTYKEMRAAELAMVREIPLDKAMEQTDVAKPLRPELDAELLTAPVRDIETADRHKKEVQKAVEEIRSMVTLSQRLLTAAQAAQQAAQAGARVSTDWYRAKAAQLEEMTQAALEDDAAKAKDVSGLMKQAAAMGGSEGADGGDSAVSVASGEGEEEDPSAKPGGGSGRMSWPPKVERDLKPIPGRKVSAKGLPAKWMYVDSWYVLGPFPNPKRINRDKKFPPESVVDLDARYVGKGGKVIRWEFVKSPGEQIIPPDNQEYAIYYAYTELWFERPMDLWVAVGSDDKSHLWVEDKPVWVSGSQLKSWQVAEGLRKVHFKKGRNRILYRVENGWMHVAFSLVLHTARR